MKNKNDLIVGKKYQIRYIGHHGYDNYSGPGVFNGRTDDIEGPVYGFKIPTNTGTCWFPLEDVFKDE